MRKLLLIAFLFTFGLSYAQKDNYKSALGTADSIYFSNPDSSYTICEEVEKNATEKEILLSAKLCRARYFLLKADLEEADKLLNEIIEQATDKSEYKYLAKAYKNKSNLLDRIGEKESAISFLEKSITTSLEINDTTAAYITKLNLSLRFVHAGETAKALACLQDIDAHNHYLRPNDYYFLNQNWGLYYLAVKQPAKALEKLKSALQIAQKNKMIDSEATVWLELSKAYYENKEIKKSEEAINNSVRISKGNNLIHELNEALEFLVFLYENTQRYKESLVALKEKNEIDKKIYDLDKINKINYYDRKLQIVEHRRSIAEKDAMLKQQELDLGRTKSTNRLMTGIILLTLVVIGAIAWYYNRSKKLNTLLEDQKKSLEKQNNIIADAYLNIRSSINYAKRIQEAILPPESYIKQYIKDFFILYLPKDIVAGDFYWVQHLSEKEVLFAVADCTGHGVPGAMVSVVSNNALNRAIKEFKLTNPSEILDKVNELVDVTFNASSDNFVNDGMDIALCYLNTETLEFSYAGANNPVWIVKNDNSFVEIRPDKQPIGYFKDRHKFNLNTVQLAKGDCVYLFSDGYADQFGGESNKKITYKKLRELLLQNNEPDFKKYKNKLEIEFVKWKGMQDQVDDVCLFGVKV